VTPLVAGVLLGGTPGNNLVQHGLLALVLAQQPPEPLDVLAHTAGAGQHDPDPCRRHVHPFVEHLAGDQHVVLPGVERLEDRPPLLGLGLVRDRWDEELPGTRNCRAMR
jgi:hypothetical protein